MEMIITIPGGAGFMGIGIIRHLISDPEWA